MRRFLPLLSLLPLAAFAADAPGDLTPAQADFFNKKVLPVLKQRCFECHSHEAGKIKGGLVVDSRDGMRKGGDTGPAVVPEKLKDSLLITAVRWEDSDFQMPPKDKLPAAEIQLFEEWIKMGAPDPRNTPASVGDRSAIAARSRDHWAFHAARGEGQGLAENPRRQFHPCEA